MNIFPNQICLLSFGAKISVAVQKKKFFQSVCINLYNSINEVESGFVFKNGSVRLDRRSCSRCRGTCIHRPPYSSAEREICLSQSAPDPHTNPASRIPAHTRTVHFITIFFKTASCSAFRAVAWQWHHDDRTKTAIFSARIYPAATEALCIAFRTISVQEDSYAEETHLLIAYFLYNKARG